MTEQQQTETANIPDEAKFLQALGVNPANVIGGTVKVEWQQGQPVIFFQMAHAVSAHALGLAFLATSPPPEDAGDNVTQMKQPEDHKPAKKAAAKKAAPKRT